MPCQCFNPHLVVASEVATKSGIRLMRNWIMMRLQKI